MAAQLNSDALREVIESLYYDKADGNPNYKALANLCLVNRLWRACAQPYLWRSAAVDTCNLVAFGRFTNALASQHLADSISSLDLALQGDRPFDLVVLACPRLYQLRVNIKVQELDWPLRDMPNVRSLILHTWPTMSRLPFDILQRTPALRHLRLQSELSCRVPDAPPRFELYELVLRRLPSNNALSWILSAARNLKILESWDFPSPPMKTFLELHGAQLRSLRVYLHSLPWKHWLAACTALEEYKTVRIPTLLSPELPPTVEHLAFANLGRDLLAPIIGLVKALPRLRAVTYDSYTQQQDDFQALKDVCAERSVVLRLDPFVFWNNEDAIPVDKFPRTKAVSNIRYMH